MPAKVFKVKHLQYMLVQNTWLGSDMHVGGCYMVFKIAFWHWCAPELKGHFGAAAIAATAASNPNQSFQGRVWALESGWKHLVGFKYAGWGLLHRPKDGSLVQLRTPFVHSKP